MTQLSILNSEEKLESGNANVWIADDDHGNAPADGNGAVPIEVKWSDATHLIVTHDARARVFMAKSPVVGISIEYKVVRKSDLE